MSVTLDFHPFVVLRTPLLPFTATQDLSEATLRRLFSSPLLTEALFIASPDLAQAVRTWLDGGALPEKEEAKLVLTLRKYLLRMAYRCTPFGLFAGISRAEWGPTTTLALVARPNYGRHTRLDMDYLCTLAGAIGQDTSVGDELLFYPNNTLYPVGQQLRYVEYNFHQKIRKHNLVTVDSSGFLEDLLELARGGRTAAELVAGLIDEEITADEAQLFLGELIDSQVLVSELEPTVTGPEYLHTLIQTLQTRQSGHHALPRLTAIRDQLANLDQAFDGNQISHYQQVVAGVKQIGTAFEPGNLFQVDMHKPLQERGLSTAVQTEIRQAVQLLNSLGIQRDFDGLKSFRTAFLEQYEQQEIPLVQVLDMEMGIGYPVNQQASTDPAPLLHDLPFADPNSEEMGPAWTAWQKFLLEKYLRVVRGQDACITLDDAELKPFLTAAPQPLASSLYCTGSLLAASAQALDEGHFHLVHQVTAGPSVASLLGRFCHLDAQLTADVQEALRAEEAQHPEAVFAEIVHINQSRIGNISARPVLRDYEIPILVQPGVDEEHTIQLQDLLVSVRGNQVILRSKRLNRQVIPRLSSAHNFSLQALPAYYFLCDLQFQQINRMLSWNWGLLRQAAFLPRVCYGKTILAKAQWVLSTAETDKLKNAAGTELLAVVQQLRAEHKLPAWVVIAEGDNKLPINLESLPHLQVLQSTLKRLVRVTLEECLFHADNLAISGPEGRFTNEFVFPLTARHHPDTPVRAASVASSPAAAPAPVRTFSLGSEWLYVKLYCGLKTADELLTEVLAPVVADLQQQGLIDQWFFIRYNDPQQHLRIRFHGQGAFYGPVVAALHAALQPYEQANLLQALRTDVYRREIERYGARNIVRSEALFHHDSEATLRILGMLEGDEGDQVRWLLALRGVDALLTDFGRTLPEKSQLLHRLQAGFKVEFQNTSAEAKKAFGNRYRKARPQIEEVLQPLPPADYVLAPALAVFTARSAAWATTVEQIVADAANQTLEVPLDDLLFSYVHMSLNRFFRSKQRMHEAVIYDFLAQYYSSQLAREKKQVGQYSDSAART